MLLVLTYDEKAFRSLDVSISELKNQMKLLADIFSLYFSCPVCWSIFVTPLKLKNKNPILKCYICLKKKK